VNENSAFQGKLLPGERILWAGRPRAGLMLTGRDLFLIPFSIAWCAFAVFWTVIAASAPMPEFALLGVAFVGIGLLFMIGRFFVDAWIRKGIHYAVTDRRVLILKTALGTELVTLSLDRLPPARFIQRRDGTGTIRFEASSGWAFGGAAGFSIWLPAVDSTPQLVAIADANKVFDLLQRPQVLQA
jgi:hypothetical protein